MTAQIILLSATFPKNVWELAVRSIPEPVNVLTLPRDEVLLKNIRQFYIPCNSDKDKFKIIELMYGLLTVGQAFIFVEEREQARELGDRMTRADHKVLVVHGGREMSKEQQAAALER